MDPALGLSLEAVVEDMAADLLVVMAAEEWVASAPVVMVEV